MRVVEARNDQAPAGVDDLRPRPHGRRTSSSDPIATMVSPRMASACGPRPGVVDRVNVRVDDDAGRRSHCDLFGDDLRDLDQDHRHVVVLIGGADERLDLAEDPLAQLARVEVSVLFDDPAEPGVAEEIAVVVHRLGDAVGVEDDDVAGVQRDLLLLEQLVELRHRAVDAQAEDHPAWDEDLCALQQRRPDRAGR